MERLTQSLCHAAADASLLCYGDPARTARNAAAQAENYHAVKLHEIDPVAVLAARDALGPDAVLMDDVNCPWSVAAMADAGGKPLR